MRTVSFRECILLLATLIYTSKNQSYHEWYLWMPRKSGPWKRSFGSPTKGCWLFPWSPLLAECHECHVLHISQVKPLKNIGNINTSQKKLCSFSSGTWDDNSCFDNCTTLQCYSKCSTILWKCDTSSFDLAFELEYDVLFTRGQARHPTCKCWVLISI